MARRGDVQKHVEWDERLGRFDASGLTVAQFCRNEGVTPHRFYYWSKRVRGGPQSNGAPTRRVRGGMNLERDQARQLEPQKSSESALGPDAPPLKPMVRFTFASGLRVAVPAHSLDAIRCVLQFARAEKEESSVGSANPAFRQVIVTE